MVRYTAKASLWWRGDGMGMMGMLGLGLWVMGYGFMVYGFIGYSKF